MVAISMVSIVCMAITYRATIPPECPWRLSQRCETSFSRIAANPERYAGRYLYTYGYVAVSDGNVYVYRNEAGYRAGEYFDRIMINLSTIEKINDVERHLYTYTVVSGVMYEDVVGKDGPAMGGLDDVTLFEPVAHTRRREGWGDVGIPIERIGSDGNAR